MPRKQVLIAGASGLVGYAAMKHFAADPGCDVIALSRRRARQYAWRALAHRST